jgi:enoyl-CoA hydratase/carnithine racemase
MNDAYGVLAVSVDAGVAWVTIDSPPTNLVNATFGQALAAVLDAAEADREIRVLVFSSADADFFLMHGDVESIRAIPPGPFVPKPEPNGMAALFERLHTSPLVSIAAVDGAARGGGAEFLAAVDLRYGSPHAVLGQPEVPMGIIPAAGGTTRLPRLLGRARALEVILTGRDVAADEALAIGWLDDVVPAAELRATVEGTARRIAAMPPASVAAVKRVVDASLGAVAAVLVDESNEFYRLTATGGHVEPMTRFLDAGGQTREGEAHGIEAALQAMLERPG